MISDVQRELEELRKEIEGLRARSVAVTEEKESLEKKNQSLLRENRLLRQRVEDLVRRIYGRRSERFTPGQLELPLFELGQEAATEIANEPPLEDMTFETTPPAPRRQRRNGRRPLPADLPRNRQELDPSPEELICRCGREKVVIGEEKTEELEYIPAHFVVNETVRKKYACPVCQEGVVIAPLPPRPIEKGRPGSGLLAHVAVSKFVDHLPLFRQEQIYARQGLDLPRSTLCDWLGKLAWLLAPIVAEMKQFILKSRLVQSDDTHVRVQERRRKGTMRRGYLWVYCLPWGEVVYDFRMSRGHDGPARFLNGFQGYLQTDAYGGYNEIFRTGRVEHIGCWAHVRRKLHEALKEAPQEATLALGAVQALYRIERDAKDRGLDPASLVELRREKSLPLLKKLKVFMEGLRGEALPKSRIGRALQYALGQWDSLVRYVDIGEAEIDNNSAESTMRPPVLGRKNWLFVGSAEGGGPRAAVLYSLLVSCKRLGVDPYTYIKDVIDRVSTHPQSRIWELTPRGWKESHAGTAQVTATAAEK
jgi:transposase